MGKTEKKAFQRGWYSIPQGKVAEARIRLMATLNVTTRMGFLNNMKGGTTHSKEEIKAIEDIFHSYGIKEIWGRV